MARSVSRLLRATLAALLAVTLLLPTLALAPPAGAATCVVTSGNESGPGTLRQHLATPSCDTITFQTGISLISVTSYLLITRSVTIQGPGRDILTIRYGPGTFSYTGSVFVIQGGTVTISDLTIADGKTLSLWGAGVGIVGYYSPTAVTLIRVKVSGNVARQGGGGGIYASNATLTLTGSEVSGNASDNTASSDGWGGGGIFLDDYFGNVSATLSSSVVSFNRAPNNQGGGVRAWHRAAGKTASLTALDSVITYNTASSGGGIVGAGGTLRLERSYVGYNQSSGRGGGIHLSSVVTTLIDSTLVGNRAGEGNDGWGGGLYSEYGTVAISGGSVLSNRAAIGGGMMNVASTMTVTGVAITYNASTIVSTALYSSGGGGIQNFDGTLTVTNSTIANNSSAVYSGGIGAVATRGSNAQPTEAVTNVINSAIIGNSARSGGGLDVQFGTVTVTNSTIANNRAEVGAGIQNFRAAFAVNGSTISGNVASGAGGGIYQTSLNTEPIVVTNSTISGNSGGGVGGGILVSNGAATLTNVTVSGNGATQGAGLWLQYTLGTDPVHIIRFVSSIVAGNVGGDCWSGAGSTLLTLGFNVVGEGTGCPGYALGDLVYGGPLAALLNPTLASNGGPTQTHALPGGSPAINRIPVSYCTVTTDQRGVARPQGAACDSGAYEAP